MADKQKTDQEPKQEGNLKKQMQDQIDAACFANSAKASVEKLLESTTSLQNNIEQHAKVFSEIGRTRPYIQQILESIENNVSIYEAAYNYAYFKQYLKLDVTTGKEPTSKELDNYATAFLNLFIEEIENASEELLNADIKELVITEQIEVDGEQRAITWLNDETPIKEIIAAVESRLINTPIKELIAAVETKLDPTDIGRYNKVNILNLSMDKLNATIWRLFADEKGQIPGQISFSSFNENDLLEISTENKADKKKGIEHSIFYGISMENANEILAKSGINDFDRRVYEAIGTLYNNGNEYVSISKISKCMGANSSPDANRKKNISDSIEKMSTARIHLDASQDYKKYFSDPDVTPIFTGNLLSTERVDKFINGVHVDGMIHIKEEPPLVAFARQRNQVSAIPIKVLQSEFSQTSNFLAIDNYLLERIARMKNGTQQSSNKILYETIFEKANIKKGKPQQRAIPKILKRLKEFRASNFIEDFTPVKDGVEIKY